MRVLHEEPGLDNGIDAVAPRLAPVRLLVPGLHVASGMLPDDLRVDIVHHPREAGPVLVSKWLVNVFRLHGTVEVQHDAREVCEVLLCLVDGIIVRAQGAAGKTRQPKG
eukprot:CAMPEP_0179093264 /NCGR_PEP_ID=MMETSP0796-20121207/42701_1 /TAXON_ID=73915 /ORGANISM="Pyrodinium bahamense, Strain pbaha01" /LENGTH=108 /DNA_ID=CAMNT_0020790891 /DNA_START=654 /DNA_END=977 /DNA_ORIENTATION=-